MSFQSVYIGATGLVTHGIGMQVMGNNLANVNTVGYKGQDVRFADLMSENAVTSGTACGNSQKGFGVALHDTQTDYRQGGFEITNSATDLAITGKGFFKVTDGGEEFYTRAGNFVFDVNGYMIDPHGYRLQGYDFAGADAPNSNLTDIRISDGDGGYFTMDPVATTELKVISNLWSEMDDPLSEMAVPQSTDPVPTNSISLSANLQNTPGNDNTTDPDNPLFSLLQAWDPESGFSEDAYALKSSVTVYDENGYPHAVDVYFDQAVNPASNADGTQYWEYVVAMDPTEAQTLSASGLLMSGTLVFDEDGNLTGQSAFTPTGEDAEDLNNWALSDFSEDGVPVFNLPYMGESGTVFRTMALDFGLSNPDGEWSTSVSVSPASFEDFGESAFDAAVNLAYTGTPDADAMTATTDVSEVVSITQDGIPSEDYTIYREDDPYFSMVEDWDPNATEPLEEHQYGYSVTAQVYDENGEMHNVTIYYDRPAVSNGDGSTMFEYMVTMNPSQDGSAAGGTSGAGLLMMGTLTFDRLGQLESQSAFVPAAGASGNLKDLSNWVPANFSSDGYPQFSSTFAGEDGTTTNTIALNFGINNPSGSWTGVTEETTAATIGDDYTALPSFEGEKESNITTNYKHSSSSTLVLQDGYPEGYLSNITVNSDGILSGHYSNGAELNLYQVSLHYFNNDYGLRREGGNLFSATLDSGAALDGAPNDENNLGKISQRALESSNVEMSQEMVTMILNQRGFQMNGKVVSTSDSLINTAIQMKK